MQRSSSDSGGRAQNRDRLSHGFGPIAPRHPRLLVLGSLPGRMSLEKQQYYGQPRNAFWTVMTEICGASPALGYAERVNRLEAAGIALWDVLAAAERPGSLDSSIVAATQRINDFAALFRRCPAIRCVFFNGRKAAELYERHVLPTLAETHAALPRATLPSTSPAYAGMPVEIKREQWQAAVSPYVRDAGPSATSKRTA